MNGHCPDTERLSAFHDGELPAGQADAVRAHVAGCATCREAITAMASVDDALEFDNSERPEADWEALAARVDGAVERAAASSASAPRPIHRSRRFAFRPLAFGGAGVLAAAALIALFFPLISSRQEIPLQLPPEKADVARPTAVAPPAGRAKSVVGDNTAAEVRLNAPEEATGAREQLETLGYAAGGSGQDPRGVKQPFDPGPALPSRAEAEEDRADGLARLAEKKPAAPVEAAPVEASSLEEAARPRAADAELKEEVLAESEAPASTESATADPEVAAEDELTARQEPTVAATSPEDILGYASATPEDAAILDSASTAPPSVAKAVTPEPEPAPMDLPVAPGPGTVPSLATLREQIEERYRVSRTRPSSEAWGMRKSYRGDSDRTASRATRDRALTAALAQEMLVFGMEWEAEGDIAAARRAYLTLTSQQSEIRGIREQAWKELIELEAREALGSGSESELLLAADIAEAFLREYPRSGLRTDVLRPRVQLWAALVRIDPAEHCSRALTSAAQWEARRTREEPGIQDAVERIRTACLD